jgi:hypothetical protein
MARVADMTVFRIHPEIGEAFDLTAETPKDATEEAHRRFPKIIIRKIKRVKENADAE